MNYVLYTSFLCTYAQTILILYSFLFFLCALAFDACVYVANALIVYNKICNHKHGGVYIYMVRFVTICMEVSIYIWCS